MEGGGRGVGARWLRGFEALRVETDVSPEATFPGKVRVRGREGSIWASREGPTRGR